jgi:hypothetical protein
MAAGHHLGVFIAGEDRMGRITFVVFAWVSVLLVLEAPRTPGVCIGGVSDDVVSFHDFTVSDGGRVVKG